MNPGNEREPFHILQFDGLAMGDYFGYDGNLGGPAGAGAVIRSPNETVLFRFHEGLGYQNGIVADYRALILGLRQVILKEYLYVVIEGSSNAVVREFQGVRLRGSHEHVQCLCALPDYRLPLRPLHDQRPHLRELHAQALELLNWLYVIGGQIQNIPEEHNTEANAQALYAINHL